jgi:hypothetical protein
MGGGTYNIKKMIRNAYKIFAAKPEPNKPLESLGRSLVGNWLLKEVLKEFSASVGDGYK